MHRGRGTIQLFDPFRVSLFAVIKPFVNTRDLAKVWVSHMTDHMTINTMTHCDMPLCLYYPHDL